MQGQVKYTMEQSVVQEYSRKVDPLDEQNLALKPIYNPIVTKQIQTIWNPEDNQVALIPKATWWRSSIKLDQN